jgi:MazG family protein
MIFNAGRGFFGLFLDKVNWMCMDLPRASSTAQDSAPSIATDPARAAALFEESVAIMARLRAPGGCPWDREQSFDSIRKYTLEEVYEVFDAIEQRDFAHLPEELGDLLLQVLFYAEMAANEGHFTIADVLEALNRKLIRRHPHVFGDEASRAAGNQADVDAGVEGSAAVLRNWEQIKTAERAAEALHAAAAPSAALHAAAAPSAPKSRLDSVMRALPALAEARKLGARAQKAGFDWPSWRQLLPKLAEETAELEAEAECDDAERKPAVEAELGDLLFTVVNLGRHLDVDAEMALRKCNLRFRRRFHEMELASPRPLEELSPEELEALWVRAKQTLAAEENASRSAHTQAAATSATSKSEKNSAAQSEEISGTRTESKSDFGAQP